MSAAAVLPLDDPARFLEDWSALFHKAEKPSFFQSPAWMGAWLDGRPEGVRLYRVEAKNRGALCLLGAVGVRKARRRVLIGAREARLHEFAVPAFDAAYIEYNDFLIGRGADEAIRQTALSALLLSVEAADAIVFRNATPALARAVNAVAATHGLEARVLNEQRAYVCGLAALRSAQKSFIETLTPSTQSKIRRSMRLYEERGALEGKLVQTPDAQARAWAALLDLHEQGWRKRGRPGVFGEPAFAAFHDRLRRLAPDACHLFETTAGGKTIGVLYNFSHEGRVMNYQSGFRFEDDNRLVPGFVSHALAAQHYLEAGYDAYDLLAGNADYKRRLAAPSTVMTSLVLERPTWRRALRRVFKRSAPLRRAQEGVEHQDGP